MNYLIVMFKDFSIYFIFGHNLLLSEAYFSSKSHLFAESFKIDLQNIN